MSIDQQKDGSAVLLDSVVPALSARTGFRFFSATIFCNGLTVQVQTVAVGWHVYEITRNPLDLGLVGLSQFAPALLLILVTGTTVDRFSRRLITALCLTVQAAVALGLVAFMQSGSQNILPVFALITLFGVARAFYIPARQALLPNIFPANCRRRWPSTAA